MVESRPPCRGDEIGKHSGPFGPLAKTDTSLLKESMS
jgi:hypothetical protein